MLKDKGPDIILLQETHITPEVVNMWRYEWGGNSYYSAGESNARGVTTLIKVNSSIKVIQQIQDKEERYLLVIARKDDEEIAICNFYSPNLNKPEFFVDIVDKLN